MFGKDKEGMLWKAEGDNPFLSTIVFKALFGNLKILYIFYVKGWSVGIEPFVK